MAMKSKLTSQVQDLRYRKSGTLILFALIAARRQTHLNEKLLLAHHEGDHGPLAVMGAAGLEVTSENHGRSAQTHGPDLGFQNGFHIANNHVCDFGERIQHFLIDRVEFRHEKVTGDQARELDRARQTAGSYPAPR